MAKKQRSISHPTPTPPASLEEEVNNVEEDLTHVDQVQTLSKTPSISTSNHEPISSDSKYTKRPNESNGDPLSPKRTKIEGSDSKPPFHRFWSFDDELIILKGMHEFISENGTHPHKFINDFHNFIKKSLHVEASSTQLKEKVRKLKLKFLKNSENPSFSNAHDSELFELSKKIWGNTEGGHSNGTLEKAESDETKEGKHVKIVDVGKDEEIENDEKDSKTTLYLMEVFQLNGFDKDAKKEGIELLGESDRVELKVLWKEFQNAELELSVRRAELVAKQARLMLEARKSSKN
ncbi:hypothetical protein TanjilG_26755 [Lupinus angustifolius]|uniref:Glabrous enhancer-binding protein-like DBD domain-containing protein n=1 Tax=Lupinus angustifolius TaxID=3871 RepID=A0A1J7H110_LUPAN|nr:PREDICTED: STOREKEEPER protein-like [Lupinus angustifolius]OIV95492.1 hypothetical protein TanjilG_26755 [Lupinus angustifolius]